MKPIIIAAQLSVQGQPGLLYSVSDRQALWKAALLCLGRFQLFVTRHNLLHRYGLYTNWKAKGLVLAINLPLFGDWSIWRTR